MTNQKNSISHDLLFSAACECLSPDQMDKFESLFVGDTDTCARFLRCVLKRVPQPPSADAAAAPADVLHALRAAKQFIANGVELGFIRMPDSDCPDPAHETPKLIDAAITSLEAAQPEPPAADDRKAMIRAREYVFDWQSEHGITLTVGAINHLARLMVGVRAAASHPAAAAGQEEVATLVLENGMARSFSILVHDLKRINLAPGTYSLYTAPPAQVATRQGLTDLLRQAREELSYVEWENDPPARVTDLFSTIDTLLEGAKQ